MSYWGDNNLDSRYSAFESQASNYLSGQSSSTNTDSGWDGDRYVTSSGMSYDTTDTDFEWKTGHTPSGDDDN